MLTRLKQEFAKYDLESTTIPITMDSWSVSEPLKQQLHQLGFEKIVIVGKGNDVFDDGEVKTTASMMETED